MSWFKTDDKFHSHPKIKSIPRKDRLAVVGLWTLAGSWCADHLTNGYVPAYMLEEFGAGHRHADLLAKAGLWDVVDAGDGWIFHDWDDHQPSREEVQEKRRKSAERVAAWRAAKKGASTPDVTPLQDELTGVTREYANADVTPPPTRPDPTRPDPVPPTEVPTDTSLPAAPVRAGVRFPQQFDDFWSIYPRKVQKDDAKRAWTKVTRATTPDTIVAGAKRMATDPNLPEKNFIPYPASWLNAGGWEDEPFPPQIDGRQKPQERLTFGGGDRPVWEM